MQEATQPTEYRMDQKRGVIALLVSTTGMGLSGLLTRGATRIDFFGNEYVAGASIGAFMTVGRMVMGLVFFAVLLLVTGKLGLFRRTRVTPSIALGGLFVGIALSCYLVAILFTSIADAVFLIYTGPLFCTILARIFRKERISAGQGVCLGLVFIGMLLTSGIVGITAGGIAFGTGANEASELFPDKPLGDFLGLLSGIFYGISLFFNGYRKDCDSTVRGVWNFLFATIGSLGVALILAQGWPLGEVHMAPQNWVFAVALWVICGPVGLGLLLVAGRNLSAIEYSTIAYWECVVSLLVSVLVYAEPLQATTMVGGLLIIVGGALPAIRTLRGGS